MKMLFLKYSLCSNKNYFFLVLTISILCSPGFFFPPDAFAAVPAQIGDVTIAPNKTQIALSWAAPSATPSITDYIIKFRIENAVGFDTFNDGVSTSASATVTGLTTGVTYEFKVAAINSDGTGTFTSVFSARTSDFEAGHEFSETQSFQAGKQFAAGTEFADGQDFSGGQMVFNGSQEFGQGTKFASGQTFASSQTFGANVKFNGNSVFADGQFFAAGTFFDDAQEFTGDKVYQFTSDGIIFGDGSGVVFQGPATFGTNADFDAGVQTFTGQNTFAAGAKIAANQDFSALPVQIFQGANTFGAGVSFTNSQDLSNGKHTFQGSTTFGTTTKFAEGQDLSFASHIFGANSIFDEFIEFSNSQEFDAVMAFDKYQHFGDENDFTEIVQTFKEGSTFGTGTSFKSDGTQSLPVGTIPAFGILLSTVTCTTSDCKPSDSNAYLPPGGLLSPGIDPVATFNSIESDDTSFSVVGLGLEMSFDSVTGDGTIKTDLFDPNDVPSSTVTSEGVVTVSTNTGIKIPTVGSVIDISVGTATISGNITITLPYEEANIPEEMTESNLTVIHFVNNEWITEPNCTINTSDNKITCTVTSLSPFGVGSKSGSTGAESTGNKEFCDSSGLGINRSLQVYHISYDLCDTKTIDIIAQSTCGKISYTLFSDQGISMGGLSIEQPYIKDNKTAHTVDLNEISDLYRVYVENKRNHFDKVIIPKKLHGEIMQCKDILVIPNETRYTSEQHSSDENPKYNEDGNDTSKQTQSRKTSLDLDPFENSNSNAIHNITTSDCSEGEIRAYSTNNCMDPEPTVLSIQCSNGGIGIDSTNNCMDPEPTAKFILNNENKNILFDFLNQLVSKTILGINH